MKLTYRGIAYEFTPQPVEAIATNVSAQYRGQNYNLCRPVCHFNPAPIRLKYRGVTYSTVPTNKVLQVLDSGNFIPNYL